MDIRRGLAPVLIVAVFQLLSGACADLPIRAAGSLPSQSSSPPSSAPGSGVAVSWAFQTCGSPHDAACPTGQVCQPGAPKGLPGFCRPAAPQCPQTGPGVCAEDANTWPNRCLTEAARIRVMHDGPCQRARPLPR